VRGVALTTLAVALAGLSDVLGGAPAPPAALLVAMGLLFVPVGVLIACARVRAATGGALLGAVQLVVHHVPGGAAAVTCAGGGTTCLPRRPAARPAHTATRAPRSRGPARRPAPIPTT